MAAAQPHEAGALERWVRLVESEYRESPGLRLTWRQVQRFWGFDHDTCHAVLHTLVSRQFLKQTANNAYARADVW